MDIGERVGKLDSTPVLATGALLRFLRPMEPLLIELQATWRISRGGSVSVWHDVLRLNGAMLFKLRHYPRGRDYELTRL